jgi:hypothetical protein
MSHDKSQQQTKPNKVHLKAAHNRKIFLGTGAVAGKKIGQLRQSSLTSAYVAVQCTLFTDGHNFCK